MDLRSLMNDGGAEDDKTKSSQSQAQQHAASQQHAALHPPPAGSASGGGGGARPQGNTGLTPLQTPSQPHSATGQFPYAVQSPAAPPPHRPHDAFSATPPGDGSGRPPSHGYQYPQRSPSQHHLSGLPQGRHAHPNSSLSPTPPHHAQTPHSVRQSPLSAISHHPHPPPPPSGGHQYSHSQHSQPSTPLGPPPLHYQRSAGSHQDLTSPYHQRSFSGASNGIISGSPAHQHHPSIAANLAESPNAYSRPSPQHQRRTSEYLGSLDRERSISVSPKTQITPRPPSLGSRHSSQQDLYSAGQSSSEQQGAARPGSSGSQSHVTHPLQHMYAAAPSHQPPPNEANEVARSTSSSIQSVQQPQPPNYPASAAEASSLSSNNEGAAPPPGPGPQSHQPQQPPTIHHQNQKMGMNHLLTPASEVPPPVNGNTTSGDMASKPNIFMKPSPKVNKAPSPANATAELSTPDSRGSLKRGAEEAPLAQPPPKQRKTIRKYVTRPPWAQLSKYNPRFQQQAQNGATPAPRPNGQPPQQKPQSNSPAGGGGADLPPWQQNPPLDMDLIKACNVLGKWEKTFRWNTPYPDMLAEMQNWLFTELTNLGDVGMDAREGTVEIEAKIGTLLQSGSDDRCSLPIKTMAVINPQANGRYHFESQMTMPEHSAMNNFLNDTIKSSMEPGRVHMDYKHLFERDSFHNLSAKGLALLPESLQRRRHDKREPRLRITTNTKTNETIARIVKIPISHLHLFNPNWKYDCRISINIEVNFDRADIGDPSTLIASGAQMQEPDRVKDRLSYKHLAYSIDLTKVERAGLNPVYELELEVDSVLLRQQMAAMREGSEHAFGDVVSGFVDNATFLMRQRVPAST